jgi:DNA-binding NtrC family response regulator
MVAEHFRPHVIIIDPSLPDMDLRLFCRCLRGSTALQGTKLIAMRRDLTEQQGQEYARLGFETYVSKPFDVQAIVQAIENAVESLPGRDVSRCPPRLISAPHEMSRPVMPADPNADSKTDMPTATTDEVIHVLLVDDEHAFRQAIAKRLELRGLQVTEAVDGQQADTIMRRQPPDVVVCDLRMPNLDGLALMRARIAEFPATAWIILTGQASVESAVDSMKLGAADYLQKPIDVQQLEHHIRQAHESQGPARLLNAARQELQNGSTRYGIVGRSRHVSETYEFVRKAARSDEPVLIIGESGTGKELVAHGIHEQGDRATRPFVTVNCAALSGELLANELFGHVEGAYPGAVGTKQGLFEMADRGTLLIDEIGDMCLADQAAVLRIIETGQFRRLGDARERVVDVRIVAATRRDLSEMVTSGTFREDFHCRLEVLRWQLAPLRERREDIPLLIQHLLARHHQRTREPKRLTPDALVALQFYNWPGNVRELANAIERAATLCDDYTITSRDLGLQMTSGVPTADGLSTKLRDVEREHIRRILEAHHGNKVATAKALGISRMKLYRKLERYGLQ